MTYTDEEMAYWDEVFAREAAAKAKAKAEGRLMTVTRRSRLGAGATSQVVQTPTGLVLDRPEQSMTGTPRQILDALPALERSVGGSPSGGCDVAFGLFIKGRRCAASSQYWMDELQQLVWGHVDSVELIVVER